MKRSVAMAGLIFFMSLCAWSIELGFNQGWLQNHYGQSFLDPQYSPQEAVRILSLAQGAGTSILRIWLFEGVDFQSVEWSADGRMMQLRPDFLKNLRHFLDQARQYDQKIYLTLFDGNSPRFSKDRKKIDRFRSLVNGESQMADDFEQNILRQLVREITPYQAHIYAIDIANEIDSMTDSWFYPKMFRHGWQNANRFVRRLRAIIRESTDIRVTASFSLFFPEKRVLKQDLKLNNVDFYDIHLYSNLGHIARCKQLKTFSKRYGKPVILGEYGQFPFPRNFSHRQQLRSTAHFLKNAEDCGFGAALAWRLSDIRSGYNPEARFSFEANGSLRPAYWYLQSQAHRQH